MERIWYVYNYTFATDWYWAEPMRPKSGLPKRKALRAMPKFDYGFRTDPRLLSIRNPEIGTSDQVPFSSPTTTLSLFSGCGGMDLGFLGGFRYLGDEFAPRQFRIVAAYDNDAKAIETYRLNIGDHSYVQDLVALRAAELPKAELLLGGFPCQDFSSCGPKLGFDGKRGRLYRVLVDYLEVHQPLVAVGENVPHLAKMNEGQYLREISEEFRSKGYKVKIWNLYCPDYGLPQHRQRVFFICVREDLPGFPQEPEISHFMRHRPIEDAIADLRDVTDETIPNQSQYFVATKATAGAGQGDQQSRRGRVAYAVRANPKARVHFHYELPRRLTVRECARLQSFPDEFVFPFSTSHNMMQIGNAVPPIVAHAVAGELSKYLRSITKVWSKAG